MTVATTHTRCGPYAGNGVSTTFAVTFEFYAASDLLVIERVTATGAETVKTLTTHYTVSGGAGGTGVVTAVTAPATGVSWTILRRTVQTQSTAFVDADSLPAKALEDGFDRAVLIGQEAADQAMRSLRLPDSDNGGAGTILPASLVRANKALVFDASGNVAVSVDDYVDQAAATAASAAAAATSATAAASSASSASASAAAASSSASASALSATAATASQSAASTSAAAAAGSATSASGSAASAATSAATASSAATAAATSSSTATAQASSAASSATAASGSAASAGTSASGAAASATSASGSASAAAASATAAANAVANTNSIWCGTANGTANAITLTPSPALGAYAAGVTIRFQATSANSGAVTVGVSALAAKPLKDAAGAALTAGALASGALAEATYNGTEFRLAGGGSTAGGGLTGTITKSTTFTLDASLNNKLVRCTTTDFTITLSTVASLPTPLNLRILADGRYISVTGAQTINGAGALNLRPGEWADIFKDEAGTAFIATKAVPASASPTLRYMRLVVTGWNSGGTNACLYEIRYLTGSVYYPQSAMTSNSAPSPLAASNSVGGVDAYKAFNNALASGDDIGSNAGASWWQIDLGAGITAVFTGVRITPIIIASTYSAPKDFAVYGSADGVTWYSLYSASGVTAGWAHSVERDFSF